VCERLAVVFARVSLLLVNFGFWVGSLWADHPGGSWARAETHTGSQGWNAARHFISRITSSSYHRRCLSSVSGFGGVCEPALGGQ
jgi:hypothetical protein